MPPDPVLALLSLIGLILYIVVGAAVSSAFITRTARVGSVRTYIAGDASDASEAYFLGTFIWPVFAAIGILWVIAYVPFTVGVRVSKYVAVAQLERRTDAS